jgi:uroporphyrin-III C-methyltransferase/precorrin-2 dehydrogenase/sirohydrochlorin ferrochelatase
MGLANARALCDAFIAHGKRPDTPAAVVASATTLQQRTLTGTLASLPDQIDAAAIKSPALIVVGEVVQLAERLAWFRAVEH